MSLPQLFAELWEVTPGAAPALVERIMTESSSREMAGRQYVSFRAARKMGVIGRERRFCWIVLLDDGRVFQRRSVSCYTLDLSHPDWQRDGRPCPAYARPCIITYELHTTLQHARQLVDEATQP